MTERDEEAAPVRHLSARRLPLLLGLYLLASLDRANGSIAALQMTADRGFGAASSGVGAAGFIRGYALLEIPSKVGLARARCAAFLGLRQLRTFKPEIVASPTT